MTYAAALAWRPLIALATARVAPETPAGADVVRPSDAGDSELVTACRRSDEASAFAALVRRHQDRVFRLVLSVLGAGAEMEAEDVTQEVFLRVHRQLASFRGESSFRSWLYRIAYNLAIDRRRLARWRLPHVGEEPLGTRSSQDAASDPHARAEASERARAIHRAIASLPDTERTVVRLHYWMDLSVDEIGDTLGMPAGTVKSHLHRGRQRLFHVLDAQGIDHERATGPR